MPSSPPNKSGPSGRCPGPKRPNWMAIVAAAALGMGFVVWAPPHPDVPTLIVIFWIVDRQVEHLGDVQPAEPVVQDRRLEPPAFAILGGRGDAGHHRQVGVDHPRAVAGRAGALVAKKRFLAPFPTGARGRFAGR